MHIFHNAIENLGASLKWQGEFIKYITAISALLRQRWSRQRMLQTCFDSDGGMKLHHLFKGYIAKVHEARWGTVAEAVFSLEPLESALRLHWSLDKYNFAERAGGEAQDGTNVVLADEGIRSELFWSYRGMWAILMGVVAHGMHWSESCPCHHGSQPQPTYFLRRQSKVAGLGVQQCPLAG